MRPKADPGCKRLSHIQFNRFDLYPKITKTARSMRWKGKHKAGLSEGYCSELLEGALASRRFCLRRRQRSSRRMNRRRGSWYCHRSTSASHSKNQQQAGQQQQPWGGESFSHLGALVSGPITLFATYDVIRRGH